MLLYKKNVFWIFAIFLIAFLSAEVVTEITISNSAPYLIEDIPNQSWPMNENLTDVFDLDDFFEDANGDSLIYSVIDPLGLGIVLSLDNGVSLFPELNFSGIVSTIFTASDGSFSIDSNEVFFSIGQDITPPQWSNPLASESSIYQNTFVNFSVLWTDDFGLKDYYFSINQGSGWVNYSTVVFTGVQNNSYARIQVSAASGITVLWKFCARDTSMNLACTDSQNFVVLSKDILEEEQEEDEEAISETINPLVTKEINDFIFSPDFFKISLKQGNVETRILKISNIGNAEAEFELFVEGLEEIVLFSEKNFGIEAGESREITIDFVAGKSLLVDEYFGKILISSFVNKEIPIVIDVNSLDLDLNVDVNLSEKYALVKPGKLVEGEIGVQSIKDTYPINVTLYIALKDLTGNTYEFSEEEFILTDYSFFVKNFTIPEDARGGDYLFYAKVLGENLTAIDSEVFEVGSRFNFSAFFKISSILIFILVLSIFVILLFLKYAHEKKKEKLLSLYLMLNELKNLIKEGDSEKAISLYVRIKKLYGEPVSEGILENKEKLKEEIVKLSAILKKQIPEKEEVVVEKSFEASKKRIDKSNKEVESGKNETLIKNEKPIQRKEISLNKKIKNKKAINKEKKNTFEEVVEKEVMEVEKNESKDS